MIRAWGACPNGPAKRAQILGRILTATLGVLPLTGQTTHAQPPTEEGTIERFRTRSRPRAVAERGELTADEKNTIQRFKDTKPSVVFVSAAVDVPDYRTLDPAKVRAGTGTGFVWDEWGHVVTNHHLLTVEDRGRPVRDAEVVEVTLKDGKTYKGRVIGTSFAFDIAVLQVFAPLQALKPIPIGRSRNLQVGQTVLAIGNPFGLDHSLTKGVISALGREIDTGYNTRILNAIQTDAAVNPGNSGGPLLDTAGRLVGMNTAIVATKGEASVGVGFAIPVDTLNKVVPLLIARGRIEPPRMGFVTLGTYDAEKLFGVRQGLVVKEVEPDSPAARAGLKPLVVDEAGVVKALGDILIGYQGNLIESHGQLLAKLEVEPPGEQVVFDVLRDGKRIQVTLDLKGPKPPHRP